MKSWIRRLVAGAGRDLVKPFDQRQKQLLSRLKRLEKRLDEAVARGQQDQRLLVSPLGASRSGRPATLRGSPIPPRVEVDAVAASADPGPAPADIVELTACPICEGECWSPVAEYNSFLANGSAPDAHASRYDYVLCHRCGVVFAKRRPVGARYQLLVERFEESLGRIRKNTEQPHVLGSGSLSESAEERVKSLAASGVFVSEESGKSSSQTALLRDRLAVAPHIELIGSLLTLKQPRVLELRPRFGAIGAALRRLYGGETFTLPLFPVQQILVRQAYGSRADYLLDYDRFDIPYEGTFDLVVGNHLLVHSVRPAETLATIRKRLAPGGHLYLYNEPDEADLLNGGKSMFKTLNPFHLQTFDAPSLGRVLRSAGFEPTLITHHRHNFVVMARVPPEAPAWEPIPKPQRARRLRRYAAARDRAILMLPADLRGRFAAEWEAVVERALASKALELDPKGHLRLVRASTKKP